MGFGNDYTMIYRSLLAKHYWSDGTIPFGDIGGGGHKAYCPPPPFYRIGGAKAPLTLPVPTPMLLPLSPAPGPARGRGRGKQRRAIRQVSFIYSSKTIVH